MRDTTRQLKVKEHTLACFDKYLNLANKNKEINSNIKNLCNKKICNCKTFGEQ